MSLHEDATPYDKVAEALNLLQGAASEMKMNPDYSAYLDKLERSCSFIEMIRDMIDKDPAIETAVAESGDGANEEVSGGESAGNGEYTPSVIPVAELLQPFDGDTRGGEDCRLNGEMNQLLSLVLNRKRAADFQPQYSEAAKLALQILRESSKDLGVVVRLIEALFIQHGLPALADGLLMINGMMETLWEDFYPEYDEYDFEPRANDLNNMQTLICTQINLRFGSAHEFAPTYASRADADKEKAVLDTIVSEIEKLDRFTYENFGDDAPDIADLIGDCKMLHKKMMEQYQVYVDQDNAALNAEKARSENELNAAFAAEEKMLDDEEKAKAREGMTGVLLEPENLDEVKERLVACNEFLMANHSNDPLPYLVNRAMYWHSALFRSTALPKADARQAVEDAIEGGRWNDVLIESEKCYIDGGHYLFDLQKKQVDAAANLGGKYAALGAVLTENTVSYISKKPEIMDVVFPDKTKTASDETKEWVNENMGAVSAAVSAAAGGGEAGSGDAVGGGDPYFDYIQGEVDSLAQTGKFADAFSLLRDNERKAVADRDKCLWRLQTVEFAIRNKQARLTIPFAEQLAEEFLRDEVRSWESDDLRIRVFQAAYDTYLHALGQKAPKEKMEYYYNLICTIDPGYFAKNA